MAFVVNEDCIKCKYTDCVETCPVDCFYEGENMLVIDPDECIDCAACEPVCPINAIVPDTEPTGAQWLEMNRTYAKVWPNLNVMKAAPQDAAQWEEHAGKFEKYFSPKPGVQTTGRVT